MDFLLTDHGYRYPIKVVTGVACTLVLIYDILGLIIWRWKPQVDQFLFRTVNFAKIADAITNEMRRNDLCEDISPTVAILCNENLLDDYLERMAYALYYTFFIALSIATAIAVLGLLQKVSK